MKKKEWNEGMNYIAPDLIEQYVVQKEQLKRKKQQKQTWMRIGALAACFALIVGALAIVPRLRENEDVLPDNRLCIPIVNMKAPSLFPKYYGSEGSVEGSDGIHGGIDTSGISVTAELIEMLPDTYTFFDDWNQTEYRLLHMKTVKLLKGTEMTEDFYYVIPVDYVMDFSLFDRFAILDMAQGGYEYSVMYNQTQGKAEQLHLVVFGSYASGYSKMGPNFMAFDSDGNFDKRLWKTNEAWIKATENAKAVDTLAQVEEKEQNKADYRYVHLLEDISGEAANVLAQLKSFENGIFVPGSSNKLGLLPEVQFFATRYINGFATNEMVIIRGKEWDGSDKDHYSFTTAQFTEADMKRLPDLTSAYAAVVDALNDGVITAPHFRDDLKQTFTQNGVFGWYAKTPNGVIGIVRVTWCNPSPSNGKFYYDDDYYIIEYGSNECRQIDNRALLQMLGDFEKTYIFEGNYNECGKILYFPMD